MIKNVLKNRWVKLIAKLIKWVFIVYVSLVLLKILLMVTVIPYVMENGQFLAPNYHIVDTIGVIEKQRYDAYGEDYYFLSIKDKARSSIVRKFDSAALHDSYLYVIGEMSHSFISYNNGPKQLAHDGLIDGEDKRLLFPSFSEMPQYVKINTQNGYEKWFHSLEEMNDEDRQIFEDLEAGKYIKKWWNPFD